MNQGVMIWLIVMISFCFAQIHAFSKCSSCKGASRGLKSSKVMDMDFLMDFHYPKAMEQPEETVVKAYPLSEHFDRLVTSLLTNSSTENPIVWEHRRIVSSEKRIGQPLNKDQSKIGTFIKRHAEDIKRDFLTVLNFHKTAQDDPKEAVVHYEHYRSDPRIRRSSRRKRHNLTKRFFVSRGIHHLPKAKKFRIDPLANFSYWTPWHFNGHLVNVTKRDTSNMRMKLSDILTRAGLKKDKEEAIKVVLPLLLSDLKESPAKNTNPFLAVNMEQPSPVISSSSGKQSHHMRNFKVKGDDGKEFSFSASSSDVQQLMEILAKPNSSVVLERVSLDKNRSMLKTQTENPKPSGRKKTPRLHKTKDAVNPESVSNTEVLQLKEFESSVYENIVQLDVPVRQSKSTTFSSESTKGETAKSGDTTGNYLELIKSI